MLSQKIKRIKNDGGVQVNVNAAIEALNSGASVDNLELTSEEETQRFNDNMERFFFEEKIVPKVIDHEVRQNTWNYPAEYDAIDLEYFFIEKCTTIEQAERVLVELELYERKDMAKLLRWCIYFMDVVQEKDLFVGVGRGSSVASYCLYLIEIHLVDSIQYGLDPIEFFKEL